MILELLPESLFSSPNIEVMLKNRTSSIVFKSLPESLVSKKMYLSSVAILLVIKGEQIIKGYDKEDLIVKEHEMVLLPKDLYVVSDFVTKKNNFKAVIFFIDDELINKYAHVSTIKNREKEISPKTLKTKAGDKIIHYVDALRGIYNGVSSSQSLVDIKVLEFLLLLELQEDSEPLMKAIIQPSIKRNIKAFMEANYLSNLKVSDYSVLTGRSDSTFSRDFKRHYGTTAKKWLIKKKLEKSHELLSSTNLNVTQVALEVGYDNVSHFIDAFKKNYGVTPKSTLI